MKPGCASTSCATTTARSRRPLIRRVEQLFDGPPPGAVGDGVEDALARLAPMLAAIRYDEGDMARYLWTDALELRRVEVDVHPWTAIAGSSAIGASRIPIRVGFAAAPAPGGAVRVLVPRYRWSLVLEKLEDAKDVLRGLVYAALVGEDPAWIYDFRATATRRSSRGSPTSSRG